MMAAPYALISKLSCVHSASCVQHEVVWKGLSSIGQCHAESDEHSACIPNALPWEQLWR